MAISTRDLIIEDVVFKDVTKPVEATNQLWNQGAQCPITYFGYLPRDVAQFVILPMLKRQNPCDPKKLLLLMQGILTKPNDPSYQEIQSAFGWKQATVLLQYVVCGDQDAAERIIRTNKALLFERALVTDYSGRTIEASPYQAALGAEDTDMLEMMQQFINTNDWRALAAKQCIEQFPPGWNKREVERQAKDSVALYTVANRILRPAGENDDEKKQSIRDAIRVFQAYLAHENSHLFKTGKHFNNLLLQEAFAQCRVDFGTFQDTYWGEVVGAIQRWVPAATAQVLCTGIHYIADKHAKIKRGFMLYNDRTDKFIPYYPLDVDQASVLGRDFAVDSYYYRKSNLLLGIVPYLSWRPHAASVAPRSDGWMHALFSDFISNKKIKLDIYKSDLYGDMMRHMGWFSK